MKKNKRLTVIECKNVTPEQCQDQPSSLAQFSGSSEDSYIRTAFEMTERMENESELIAEQLLFR